jgi:hypothetical protein
MKCLHKILFLVFFFSYRSLFNTFNFSKINESNFFFDENKDEEEEDRIQHNTKLSNVSCLEEGKKKFFFSLIPFCIIYLIKKLKS